MADKLNAAISVLEGGEEQITSYYGIRRDPVTGKRRSQHLGIDLISGIGNRTVVAFAPGKVTGLRNTYSGPTTDGSAGNYMAITHADGVRTLYKHLAQDSLRVKKGAMVEAGQPLATMGDTGHATGVHLHFDVELVGERVDPLPFLRGEKKLPGLSHSLFGNRGDRPVVRWGERADADVRDLQALMRNTGHYAGPVDGIAGKYTLRAAQRHTVARKVDGAVSRWVQQRLCTLGYYHGRVDGEPRSLTDRAIRAFQRDYGLTQDGRIADSDWYYLLAVE